VSSLPVDVLVLLVEQLRGVDDHLRGEVVPDVAGAVGQETGDGRQPPRAEVAHGLAEDDLGVALERLAVVVQFGQPVDEAPLGGVEGLPGRFDGVGVECRPRLVDELLALVGPRGVAVQSLDPGQQRLDRRLVRGDLADESAAGAVVSSPRATEPLPEQFGESEGSDRGPARPAGVV
jgi:hypothetical protein